MHLTRKSATPALVRAVLVWAALAGLTPVASAQELIYGMTAATSLGEEPGIGLVTFLSNAPGTVTAVGAFSGVTAGQAVRSIDFRPATGQLYAISTDGLAAAQLYTVNLTTAALTPVGTGFSLGTGATANNSPRVEIDFNPVVDRIRILTPGSENGALSNNFRANPNTGALVNVDTNLAFATGDINFGSSPSIAAAAYSNNVAGATTTTLYAWDYATFDALVTVGGLNGSPSPNGGLLTTVAEPPAFITAGAGIGMDISSATGTDILYVAHDDPATGTISRLYIRDLVTGLETPVGIFGGGVTIADLTVFIAPVPEPTGLLLAAAGVGLVARCRRRSR